LGEAFDIFVYLSTKEDIGLFIDRLLD